MTDETGEKLTSHHPAPLEEWATQVKDLLGVRDADRAKLSQTEAMIHQTLEFMSYWSNQKITTARVSATAQVMKWDWHGKDGGLYPTGESLVLESRLLHIMRATIDSETGLIMLWGESAVDARAEDFINYRFALDEANVTLFHQSSYGDFSAYEHYTDDELLRIKQIRCPLFDIDKVVIMEDDDRRHYELEAETIDRILSQRGSQS